MEMVMMSLSPSQSNSKPKMNFEETELRLGLPGKNGNGKRWFSETSSMDLKLNLSSKETSSMDSTSDKINNNNIDQPLTSTNDQVKPPTETQVVGWPPVRNFRKNIVATVQKSSSDESGGALVKVSMDGAPYLRKVDLKMYKSYKEFSDALSKMFSLFTTTGNYEAKGMINFMEEKKLMDLLNNSDYVPSYEDKDGDWMLVGDVPWEMFVESCKRLRIMKGTEAAGLAPRVMEKCKNRS